MDEFLWVWKSFVRVLFTTYTNRIGFTRGHNNPNSDTLRNTQSLDNLLRKLLVYVRLRVSDARPGIHSLKYTYVASAVRKIARAKGPSPGYVTTVPCVNLNRTSRADNSNALSAVTTSFIRGWDQRLRNDYVKTVCSIGSKNACYYIILKWERGRKRLRDLGITRGREKKSKSEMDDSLQRSQAFT